MEPEKLVVLQMAYEALVKLHRGKTFRCYWQNVERRRGIDGRLENKPTKIKGDEKVFDIGLLQKHYDEFVTGRSRELRLAVQTVLPFLNARDMGACDREVRETFMQYRLGIEWNGNPNTYIIIRFGR